MRANRRTMAALTVIIALTLLALSTLLGLAFGFAGLVMCLLALAGYGIGGIWGAAIGTGLGLWPVLSIVRGRLAAMRAQERRE